MKGSEQYKALMDILSLYDVQYFVFNIKKGLILHYLKENPTKHKLKSQFFHTAALALTLLTGRNLSCLGFYIEEKAYFLIGDVGRIKKYEKLIKQVAKNKNKGTLEFDDQLKIHKLLGEFAGYPECCINQYINDLKGGKQPADRYMQQLESLIRQLALREDPHGVKTIHHKDGTTVTGSMIIYIPCSPMCEKSRKIKAKIDALIKNGKSFH